MSHPPRLAALLVPALCLALASEAGAAAALLPRLDAHGDRLPPGAVARLGTVRFRTGGGRRAYAPPARFSPDGALVTLHDGFGPLRVCSTRTGAELWRAGGPEELHVAAGFTPDSKLLATVCSDGHVVLWHAREGTVRARVPGLRVYDLRVKGDRSRASEWLCWLLVGLSDDPLRLRVWAPFGDLLTWDEAGGARKGRHRLPMNYLAQAHFLPDGRLAYRGDERTLCLRNLRTGAERRLKLPGSAGLVAWRWSPDGRRLAVALAGHNGALHILDEAGRELWRAVLQDSSHAFRPTFAFSPDGRRLAVHGKEGLLVRCTDSGKVVRQVCPPGPWWPTHLHFLGKGEALAAQDAATVRVFDLATGAERRVPAGHAANVEQFAFSGDGKVLMSADGAGAVHAWDVAGRKHLGRVRPGSGQRASLLAVSTDGQRVAASEAFGWAVAVYDARSGKRGPVLEEGHRGPGSTRYAAFSHDGATLVTWGCRTFRLCGNDRTPLTHGGGDLTVWDMATGRPRLSVRPPGQMAWLGFWPGRRELVLGSPFEDGKSAGWEALALAPDTGATRRAFRAPLPAGQKPIAQPLLPPSPSPDGRLLAVSAGQEMRLFETVTGAEVGRFSLSAVGILLDARLTADGRYLAVTWPNEPLGGDGSTLVVWDLLAGKALSTVRHPDGEFLHAALSPDGRCLAAATADTSVVLYPLPPPPREAPLPAAGLDQAWCDLSGEAVPAFRAVRALTARPEQALALCRARLRPAASPGAARLVQALGADDFATRQAATEALVRLGTDAIPALRTAIEARPSLELRRRAEALLARVEPLPRRPDQLRAVRAAQVLEQVGTAEARAVLRELARGGADAGLTVEARAALGRLER
jgi:WD40 repeat protein